MKQKNDIRIIIDTNLWISFLIGRKLSRLLDLLSYPEFHLVIFSAHQENREMSNFNSNGI